MAALTKSGPASSKTKPVSKKKEKEKDKEKDSGKNVAGRSLCPPHPSPAIAKRLR
jgi:hypothetical protein